MIAIISFLEFLQSDIKQFNLDINWLNRTEQELKNEKAIQAGIKWVTYSRIFNAAFNKKWSYMNFIKKGHKV